MAAMAGADATDTDTETDTGRIERLLGRLGTAFDLDRLAAAGCDAAAVRRYYRATRWAYSRFHDTQNTLHVGLSQGGRHHPSDVFRQLEMIARYLPDGPSRVLELATGRGANARWLAEHRPGIEIEGIDLSPVQLRYAGAVARRQPGYQPRRGDFHDLSGTADASIDLAFVIDALCYSPDKGRVIAEVARRLRPGGVFLVFDGYATRPPAEMPPAMARAALLLARGMAVPVFDPYPAFREIAEAGPLTLEHESDLTEAVIPGVRRFGRLAERFLKRPGLARAATAVLPRALTGNVVSGLLFAPLLEEGVVSYWLTVLRKTEG